MKTYIKKNNILFNRNNTEIIAYKKNNKLIYNKDYSLDKLRTIFNFYGGDVEEIKDKNRIKKREPIYLGWKFVTGEPTKSKFPFRSFWLIPNDNKNIVNIQGKPLEYVPIYVSSGSNSPLSFLPLPFFGFISMPFKDKLIGFLMKANTLHEELFNTKEIKKNYPKFKNVKTLLTNTRTLQDKDVKDFVSQCQKIFKLQNEITEKSLVTIKEKLGSNYLLELIDIYKKTILEFHNKLKITGEQYVDEHLKQHKQDRKYTTNSNEYQKMIEHISFDKMKQDLISNLNELNKQINDKKANIFLDYSYNKQYDMYFETLKKIIDKKCNLYIQENINIAKNCLFALYPATFKYKLKDDKNINTFVFSLIYNLRNILSHKLDQILFSYRLDNIIDGLIKGNLK